MDEAMLNQLSGREKAAATKLKNLCGDIRAEVYACEDVRFSDMLSCNISILAGACRGFVSSLDDLERELHSIRRSDGSTEGLGLHDLAEELFHYGRATWEEENRRRTCAECLRAHRPRENQPRFLYCMLLQIQTRDNRRCDAFLTERWEPC